MTPPGRLAFVTPRYGPDVVGGSEAVMREAAHGLAGRGWQVDLLTTCARDHFTWANVYPPGRTQVGQINVERFPVIHGGTTPGWVSIAHRIQRGEIPSLEDQRAWLDGLFRVPELFHHLVVNAETYDAIVLSPYLFWTTATAIDVFPGRTVVMPCLHDEPYARLDVLRPVLATPAGLWFLSEPEHELAHRLGPVATTHTVTGAGVEIPSSYDPEGFRARHGLEHPFLLWVGRREGGKGWDWLMNAFSFFVQHYDLPLDLVTIGVGDIHVPPAIAARVHDLGFLDQAEIPDAYAAAAAFVQPSVNESFSRTIMEAWLAGTIVVATAGSEVLSWHCRRSEAGLLFRDEFDFVQCLAFVCTEPDAARRMAASGRQYVLANYTWDNVLDRMHAHLQELTCASS